MDFTKEQIESLIQEIKKIDYNVVDCISIYDDKDVLFFLERLDQLDSFIKYYIVVDVYPFCYEQNITKFKKYKSKIVHLHLKEEDIINGMNPFLAFRAGLSVMVEAGNIFADDLVLIGATKEIPSLLGLLIAKSYYPQYQKPICINMRYWQGFMNRLMDYEIAGTVIAPIHLALVENGPDNIRNNRQNYDFLQTSGNRYDLDIFDQDLDARMVKKEYLPTFIQENWNKYKEYCHYE